MAQTLRLEYECTEAEQQEAQTLGLHKQLGGGSKWRARLVLLFLTVGLLLGLYFKLRTFSPAEQPWILAVSVVAGVGFVVWKRRTRERSKATTQVEVSEQGLTVVVGEAKSLVPWSGFGACLESPDLFVLQTRDKLALLILPKRVFPSDSWQSWFRALANQQRSPAELAAVSAPSLSPTAGSLTLQFQLGLRDYFDRALASSFTWAMVLGFTGLLLGTAIYAALHPPPHPVYSSPQLFLFFELPFMVAIAAMILCLSALYPWLSHKKLLMAQQVALSEQGLDLASIDGSHHNPWNTYDCYKETPWSFLLWRRRGGLWLLLPKRAFPAPDGLDRCRTLLSRHLRPSRWYFG